MKPLMTFWVEKDAIVCPIFPTVTSPFHVMAMPSCEFGNLAGTERTEAALLFPEVQQGPFSFQVVYHLYVKPFFRVHFPFRIIGICFAPNFDVLFMGENVRFYQTNWFFSSLTLAHFPWEHSIL